MKTLFLFIIGMASLLAVKANGQNFQFGQPTFLFAATNSVVIQTNFVQIPVASITEQISGMTNATTIVTNNVIQSFNLNGANPIAYSTFVFQPGVTNQFSTNYPAQTIIVPVYTFFQAIPQTPNVNTCFIK